MHDWHEKSCKKCKQPPLEITIALYVLGMVTVFCIMSGLAKIFYMLYNKTCAILKLYNESNIHAVNAWQPAQMYIV